MKRPSHLPTEVESRIVSLATYFEDAGYLTPQLEAVLSKIRDVHAKKSQRWTEQQAELLVDLVRASVAAIQATVDKASTELLDQMVASIDALRRSSRRAQSNA